ncbi:MAG: hypothetical protein HFF47_01450 [Lawsonibacter sp.]|jgi:hypothetical protein|nr:hypothetical protein [Lawsonibacter sp.]
MKTTKITLTKLVASDGMMLTDGQSFGKEIYIGKGSDPSVWREVSEAEASEMQAALETQRVTEEGT